MSATEWVPPSKFIPHTYQVEAIKHMLSVPGCGLFMNPGLGKTSSVLAAVKVLLERKLTKGALIVSPLRVMRYTWPAECLKWEDFEHFKISTIHGPKKEEAFKEKADIYLINFEGLLFLLPKIAKLPQSAWPFDTLIVDESTKLKAYNSKRFKLLKPLLGKFRRRIIMTGTPTPNSMMDIFAQAMIMDCGKALTQYITHFRNEYFYLDMSKSKPGEPPNAWDYKIQPGGADRINDRIKHLVYSSNGAGFIKDQTPIFNDVFVELPPAARAQYRTMEKVLFSQLESGIILAANAAVASGKCRQIANGHLYTDDKQSYEELHSEKLDAMEDLIEELSGNPVLVWYEYKSDLARLRAKFPGEVLTAKSPDDVVERWNRGETPILYVHWQSAAHGLNLQFGGFNMIYFCVPWSGEGYSQGIARLARQGQKHQVIVHRILARRTIDELIVKTLAKREATQEDFLKELREYWLANKQSS